MENKDVALLGRIYTKKLDPHVCVWTVKTFFEKMLG